MSPRKKTESSSRSSAVTGEEQSARSSQAGARRKPKEPPGIARLRLLYDVAEMYFVQGKIGKEIAAALRLKSYEVTRFKQEALRLGIVDVKLRVRGNAYIAKLEADLISQFDLLDARIVIDSANVDITERIAQEAADYVMRERLLRNGMTVGLGAGAPMSYFGHHLDDASERLKELVVRPLVATYTRTSGGTILADPYPSSRSATYVAFEAANRLKGGPKGPPGIRVEPVFADLDKAGESAYEAVMTDICETNGLLITGATTTDPRPSLEAVMSTLSNTGSDGKVEALSSLQNKGAVAFTSGRFYDAKGAEVSCKIHALLGALSLEQLKKQNRTIRKRTTHLLISGAAHRVPGIRAILAGGTVTHLITDYGTATGLIVSQRE